MEADDRKLFFYWLNYDAYIINLKKLSKLFEITKKMPQKNSELIFSVCWRASLLFRYKNIECDLTKTGRKLSTEICVECERKLSINLFLMLIL